MTQWLFCDKCGRYTDRYATSENDGTSCDRCGEPFRLINQAELDSIFCPDIPKFDLGHVFFKLWEPKPSEFHVDKLVIDEIISKKTATGIEITYGSSGTYFSANTLDCFSTLEDIKHALDVWINKGGKEHKEVQ